MPETLPYVSTPGTIDNAFQRIKEAATPPRFTNDFVNTVLQIKGGTGAAIPPFLKRIGFLNSDGTPTGLYERLRNPSTSGAAVAEAIRIGYKSLYRTNEYAHKLNDTDLKGLILQVTGLEKDNRVAQLIFGTLKKLKSHAAFDVEPEPEPPTVGGEDRTPAPPAFPITAAASARGVNLSYTINLNLPATTNIEVFNAIFKSLREHLLDD
jgi:hypothetical protein